MCNISTLQQNERHCLVGLPRLMHVRIPVWRVRAVYFTVLTFFSSATILSASPCLFVRAREWVSVFFYIRPNLHSHRSWSFFHRVWSFMFVHISQFAIALFLFFALASMRFGKGHMLMQICMSVWMSVWMFLRKEGKLNEIVKHWNENERIVRGHANVFLTAE